MEEYTPEIAISNAEALFSSRYKGSEFCVASGSIIQGYGTAHSDLDLVVIFQKIETAFRESFLFNGLPVEAFVHDYETIQAFMDGDYEEGHASMQHIIATGKIIPHETEAAIKLRRYAKKIVSSGLKEPKPETIDILRYAVTDLIDDLKGKRPLSKQRSILYSIYQKIGELRLRVGGQFLGSGKHLARNLKHCDPLFFDQLESIMLNAHADGVTPKDIILLQSLLQPLGGRLFDGYKQDAPSNKRSKVKWLE